MNEKDCILEKSDLEEILNKIPDIIKVHNPDHTICFFNEAGSKFYRKTLDQVEGHKCYEALDRTEPCKECAFAQAVNQKEIICQERYIPELDKIMDICYNPIFDKNGKLKFVVERLTDITEKKLLSRALLRDNDKYKQVINNLPDALAIVKDGIIIQVNNLMCKFFGKSYEEVINSKVWSYCSPQYLKAFQRKVYHVIKNKKLCEIFNSEYRKSNGDIIYIQMVTGYMEYDRGPAVYLLFRDNTKIKNELKTAAALQKNSLNNNFKSNQYINIERIYVPANIISGDFYRVCKIDDEHIVGAIADVRGKGINAALSVSAIDILFMQEIGHTFDLKKVIENLNEKLVTYYDKTHIAVCAFSLDFSKKELKVVGAGINKFLYKPAHKDIREEILKGSFLGMFKGSKFEEKSIYFNKGDKVFLFTHGFDIILKKEKSIKESLNDDEIEQIKSNIYDYLQDELVDYGKLKDDCTMLAINIK